MPTIKIYESLADISKKKIKMINYLKNELNENIYIFKLLQLTDFTKKKLKPIQEIKIDTLELPQKWKLIFDESSEIKEISNNGLLLKTNKILFYLSSTLDSLTRLNNLNDSSPNLTDEEKKLIMENINFLYNLPMHSIIILDFEEELKTLTEQEILLINPL